MPKNEQQLKHDLDVVTMEYEAARTAYLVASMVYNDAYVAYYDAGIKKYLSNFYPYSIMI
jgi:myo-inositol-hexaphosphate 3-phosphohydrolase